MTSVTLKKPIQFGADKAIRKFSIFSKSCPFLNFYYWFYSASTAAQSSHETKLSHKNVSGNICGNAEKVSYKGEGGEAVPFPHTIPTLVPAGWNRDVIAGMPAIYHEVNNHSLKIPELVLNDFMKLLLQPWTVHPQT